MNREDEIFSDALDVPESERAAFLERACAGDASMRARIDALLLAHQRSEDFLPAPPLALRGVPAEGQPGESIGGYRLRRVLGEGGCGVVWLAEQGEPLHRQVALKVIKLGMDTKEVIARFEAERHVLALMDHPNIARVFDAGATEAGRPFFVMEYVQGIRITDFCDEQGLSTRDRLTLFTQVCRAIQHAHQKGIIHRDIKPSNVLVTLEDGIPVPKVIDFGIAKATSGHGSGQSFVTALGQVVGTPAYMSPEQLEPSGHDIDTRSDVYSLGVLLYELLTGRPPFDPRTLAEAGLDEMRRVVREKDPPRPSTRLSTLTDADRSTIARQRATEPRHLMRTLRGDLDWIVLRCLEKKVARRYDGASELARDIERHLHQEPVTARPPSSLYRLGKLVARNRAVSASVATAAAALVVVAAGASWLAWRGKETQRALERQSSRTDVTLGSQLLRDGKVAEGLAFLVRAARTNPEDHALGPRLMSALAYRSFVRPLGPTLALPDLLHDFRYSADGNEGAVILLGLKTGVWSLVDGRQTQPWKEFLATDAIASVPASRPLAGDLSPDLRHRARGGSDGFVRVTDHVTGREILPPLPHPGSLATVWYSSDGRWIVSRNVDGHTRIWDAATGEQKAAFESGHVPSLFATLRFSPDNRRLFLAADDAAKQSAWGIWQVPGGEPVIPLQWSSTRRTRFGVFSPDGRYIAVADDAGAQLYDATTGTPVGPHLDHKLDCAAASFSQDGTRLATGSTDGYLKIWAVPSDGVPLFEWRESSGIADATFINGDRTLLTLSGEGRLRIWDAVTYEAATAPLRHTWGRIYVSPEGGEFLTYNRDARSINRWSTAITRFSPRQGSPEPGRIGMFNTAGGSAAFALHPEYLQPVQLPSGAAAGPARRLPEKFDGQSLTLRGFMAEGGGAMLGRQSSGALAVWDLRGPEIVLRPLDGFSGDRQGVDSRGFARFSPDARLVAVHHHVNKSCRLGVWDTHTGARVGELISGVAVNGGFEFSPDNRLLAYERENNDVVLWDLAAGGARGAALESRVGPVHAIRISPDGRLVAIGNRAMEVQLWDLATGRKIGTPLRHRWHVMKMEFSQDSRQLLVASQREALIWDTATGASLVAPMEHPVAAHWDEVRKVVFSADERRVATFSNMGGICVFDRRTGQLLVEPIRAGGGLFLPGCGFDATGRFVTVAKETGDFSIWPLPLTEVLPPVPEWLLQLATAVAGGTLDRHAAFHEDAAGAATIEKIRLELARLPADSPYADWGRWFLADPATRASAPGFTR